MTLIELSIEICLAHQDEVIQELDLQSGIEISLGGAYQSNIVVRGVDEAHTIKADDRRLLGRLGSHNLVTKVHDLLPGDIFSEPPVNQNVTFLVHEYD